MKTTKRETRGRPGESFAPRCIDTLAGASRPRAWGEGILQYRGEILEQINHEEMKSVPSPDSSPGTREYLRLCDLQLAIVHAFMTVAWEQGVPWQHLRDTLHRAQLPPFSDLFRGALEVPTGGDRTAHRAFFGVFGRMLAKVPTQRVFLMSRAMDMIGPIDSPDKAFRAVNPGVVEPGRPVGESIS